jgi:hypothetical protein
VACIASADLKIQILSTAGAKPFAVLLTERSRRQGKQHLLAQNILNRKTASFIVPDFGIGGRDGVLRGVSVDTGGAEQQVKVFFEPMRHWIEASGTGHFKITLVAGAQTNVMDQLMGPVILREEISAAAYWHAVYLANPGTVIDGAGGNRLIELKRLPFKLEHRYQYGHGILTVVVGPKRSIAEGPGPHRSCCLQLKTGNRR